MDCATTQSEGQHTALGTLLVHNTMAAFFAPDRLARLDLVLCSTVWMSQFNERQAKVCMEDAPAQRYCIS